jgi:hypothetical protein
MPRNVWFSILMVSLVFSNLAPRLLPVVESYRNPYLVVYGRLSQESQPLRNSILFASALHLSKLGALPNDAIKTCRADMRDSFRNALHDPEEAWGLGATVLLSIVFDVRPPFLVPGLYS